MNAPVMIPAISADGALYPVEKLRAHVDGLLHLAVSIFIFDGDALLIQRRAAGKYHCPGQWANTCCSHPHWNESLTDCAARRLEEELGFRVPLEERQVVEYHADVGGGLFEHERVTMFSAQVDRTKIAIRMNPDEVDMVRWADAAQLRDEIEASPENFAPWFKIYLERFPDLAI